MKLLNKFFLMVGIFSVFGFNFALAAGIDHFNVVLAPDSANIGEAFDLTIEALDKNGATVTNYVGSILVFSESDPEAEIPKVLQESIYKFKASDQGKVKFENSIKFKKSGKQSIQVYDLNDDTILGVATADVTGDTNLKTEDVQILSPENGLTIGDNKIKISGKTKKNYQVKILTNGKNSVSVTSNNQGLFEKEITNLPNGENYFTAQILDADNKVIGDSNKVTIKVSSGNPAIKSIKITPKKDVPPESKLNAEIISNKGLKEVSLIINDVVTKLDERGEGVYRGIIIAPKEAGEYNVDANIKDDLGHDVKELGVETVSIKVDLNAGNGIVADNQPGEGDLKNLKITGIKLVELKTKSILTWDKLKDAESYNVYKKLEDGSLELVKNVSDSKIEIEITGDKLKYEDFAIKSVAKTQSGEIYEGDLSDVTKLKTGPELIILIVLSILLGLFVIYKKRFEKKSA